MNEIKCPNCGENLAKIIYGLVPDPGEALKKKKVFKPSYEKVVKYASTIS